MRYAEFLHVGEVPPRVSDGWTTAVLAAVELLAPTVEALSSDERLAHQAAVAFGAMHLADRMASGTGSNNLAMAVQEIFGAARQLINDAIAAMHQLPDPLFNDMQWRWAAEGAGYTWNHFLYAVYAWHLLQEIEAADIRSETHPQWAGAKAVMEGYIMLLARQRPTLPSTEQSRNDIRNRVILALGHLLQVRSKL